RRGGQQRGVVRHSVLLEVVPPDHLFIEQNIAGERTWVLRADEHGAFTHGNRFFKGLWRLTGFGHAEDVPWRADSAYWGQHIKTDPLVLILHSQALGETLEGGFGGSVHEGARRGNVLIRPRAGENSRV